MAAAAAFPSSPDAMAPRAAWFARAGGLNDAIAASLLPDCFELSFSEALVLGLARQGVTKYLVIFGHGSTAFGEVLRIYEEAGLVSCWQFRNEVEMAHAATALRWIYGETCAVVTSIGPGALQAMAGSLAAAANGIGVYHIYGDETTYGEGYNMQQIPKPAQGLFGQITAAMGQSYTLYEPNALRDALRRGAQCVFHPWKAVPFFLNLPMNVQAATATLRLASLPERPHWVPQAPVDDQGLCRAAQLIASAQRIAIKAGGGSRFFPQAVRLLAETTGAVVVLSPGSTGVLPDSHPHNMHVGGSKGSISGNHAMDNADLLIVIGSRAVCQSDCSGTGWPKVRQVININADPIDVQHYNHTLALTGDAGAVITRLCDVLSRTDAVNVNKAPWLAACLAKKQEWKAFKAQQYAACVQADPVWGKPVMTQPQAIKTAADFCKSVGAMKIFDAGDVQANGFQIVEDDAPLESITEAGASYMGFAVSALLAGAVAQKGRYAMAFTGDGSFMMNPQVLIDGVEHGVHATILLLDNRRMAAISHLQTAQYNQEFRTSDTVAVDYVAMAAAVKGVLALYGGTDSRTLRTALARARAHKGLSLVHVPVYYGDNAAVGLGAYGRWNVGSWCRDVQALYARSPI